MSLPRESDLQLLPRPRPLRDLVADLRGHQEFLRVLQGLACEFVNLDIGPIVIVDGLVQPRDISALIPPNLRALMQEEATAVAQIQHEIHLRRECPS